MFNVSGADSSALTRMLRFVEPGGGAMIELVMLTVPWQPVPM